MRPVLSYKGFIFSILFVGLASQETELIKKLDHGYSSAKSIDDLLTLEKLAKRSLKIFPESDKLYWSLGRIYFKLGKKSEAESKKTHYFSLCMVQTKKTIEINSQSASGYFYNGLCNGMLGQLQGIWSSLETIEPFKKDMENTISIDPSVEEGGPHRALGNLYLKLPYILGGDSKLSIIHFQRAIQLGPKFGENYIGLAEAYIENGDFMLAKNILYILLDMELSSPKDESVLEWKADAMKLLKNIKSQ
jgi:tetratricopeptide (TPR) repeat protein